MSSFKNGSWSAWGTNHEIKFINTIGSYCPAEGSMVYMSLKDRLLKYQSAALLRKEWCGMDRSAILAACKLAIEKADSR
jgi:hypothetical protein